MPTAVFSGMPKKSFAVLSAVIFAADALFELGRVALGRPWPGIAAIISNTVSAVWASLWLSAAALQLLRFRDARLHPAAQLVAIAGVLAMVFHAAVTRVLGSFVGLANLALALAQVPLLHRNFDRDPRSV
jgi:hypothetical protein